MASDTRVSDIEIKENSYGDSSRYFADCGRKTFLLKPYNIGISFFGSGYFQDLNSEAETLLPIAYFLPGFTKNLKEEDSISVTAQKIVDNIKQISTWEKCKEDVFLSGFIAGIKDNVASFISFNTCYNKVAIVDNVEPGNCFEKNEKEIRNCLYSDERLKAIDIINEKMIAENLMHPFEVGGPTDILEVLPEGRSKWLFESPHITDEEKIMYASYPNELYNILKLDKLKSNRYNLTLY